MFELDPKLNALDVTPAAVLEIHHSLNTAEVATKEFVGEPAKAFICLIASAPERRTIYISFFFPNKNRTIFYRYLNNPFAPALTDEVKDEAMIFLESFGFIMERVVGEASSAKDKEHWRNRVPFFKAGGPAGEIILRSSAHSFPADGTSQFVISSDLIHDAKGQMVPNGTKIKVWASLGLVGTLEEEPKERQLMASTIEGMITFLIKAPEMAGKAVITAASDEGSAAGELTIDFLPLEPAGDIKLSAIPARVKADGMTLVGIQSEPISDNIGNLVADDTSFSIEISDQERVLSSVQVTSQKGIIRHQLTAPSTPVTMLITAKSQKGQAQGELVLTFEAPLPVLKEELPSVMAALEKLPLPEDTPSEPVFVPESSPEAGEAPFLEEVKPSKEVIPPQAPSPVSKKSPEESVFQEEVAPDIKEALDKLSIAPSMPATTETVEEKISVPSPVKASPSEALMESPAYKEAVPPLAAPETIPVPEAAQPLKSLEQKPAESLRSEKVLSPEKSSPSGDSYKDLIRFLTHM